MVMTSVQAVVIHLDDYTKLNTCKTHTGLCTHKQLAFYF